MTIEEAPQGPSKPGDSPIPGRPKPSAPIKEPPHRPGKDGPDPTPIDDPRPPQPPKRAGK